MTISLRSFTSGKKVSDGKSFPAKDRSAKSSLVNYVWSSEGVSSFFTATFAPIVLRNSHGVDELMFPIVPSYNPKRDLLQYKAPGGDDGQDLEFPWDCAIREWTEEVMKVYSKVKMPPEAMSLIYVRDLPDERFVGGRHRKSFWMLPLRLFDKFSNAKRHFRDVDIEDGDDILRPIKLISVAELAGAGERRICKTHLHALALVIIELAKIDVVYDLLPDGLLEWAMLPDHVVNGTPIYFEPKGP